MTFSWREPGQAKKTTRRFDDDDTKPLLTAVFDHYGVEYDANRTTGMTHCPLHEDRTPSMSFNTDKGLWRCHSCGEGGDSYSLLMTKEGTDFRGARAVAASLQLAEGSTGGGDEQLSGSRYGGRRAVPRKPGDRAGGGGYVPSWRGR
ncbi:DNA primase [Streptomyces phage Celia]|uniref:DNA primase n=1 Tax=Streptomyces phage Celia TaxID=2590946 RepID=A0A516KRH7_9CAUD|nr:DNA primase [Streptomyces phage Celia]QDP44243.1 DNA primase [Streptomyces phage Celia]QFG10503.1 DNA primase [Streptomyces phage Urza]QJD50605.1 DNA primase [Streptomyces phage Itza]